jgi:hypothetical protein
VYLENKNEVEKLSNAFQIIEVKNKATRTPANEMIPPLADSTFSAFLDYRNSYHVLLSYKIKSMHVTVRHNNLENAEESKIRNYERDHSLVYQDEIAKILNTGNFDNHFTVEQFLIDEFALFNPSEAVNIVEKNLEKQIVKYENRIISDENHFQNLLSTYFEMIRKNNIDENERRLLLERQIKSPKLKLVLFEFFNETDSKADLPTPEETPQPIAE